MKRCPSCSKELPDSALVCVFCRTKLSTVPPPMGQPMAGGGSAASKTLMGYSAVTADLLKGVGAPPTQAPPRAAPPAPVPAAQQAQYAATMMVAPGQGQPQYPPQPQYGGPPGVGMPPAGMAPPAPGYSPPMPVAPAPAYAPPAHAYAAPVQAHAYAAPVQPIAQAIPPAASAPSWKPAAAASSAGPATDFDVFTRPLKLVLLTFAVILALTVVAPWALKPNVAFSWNQLLRGHEFVDVAPVLALYLAVVLGFVFGLVPAGSGVRGFFAVIAGGGMIASVLKGRMGHELGPDGWRFIAALVMVIIGPTALVLRRRYRASMAARALAAVAVLATLLVYLVPSNDQVPLVELVKLFGAPKLEMQIGAGIGVATFLIFLLPLTAFASAQRTGFGTWTILIAVPVLVALLLFGLSGIGPEAFGAAPVLAYLCLWMLASTALIAYGLAALFGKLHDSQTASV